VAALNDSPVVVLGEGEAGIGKTRLVHECLAAPSVRDRRVVVTACPPVRDPLPMGPIVAGLRGLRPRVGSLALSPLAGALRPLFPEWTDDLPPALEPLADPAATRQRLLHPASDAAHLRYPRPTRRGYQPSRFSTSDEGGFREVKGAGMRQGCPVFDGDRVSDRLAELGLKAEFFEFALRGADAEARTYTLFDPPNMAGMARYARMVRLLREQLVPLGWSYDNPRNLARTVSPDRRVAIVTALGDAATGVPHVPPSTRYEKGLATVEAVNRNFLQLTLPMDLGDDQPVEEQVDGVVTWVLLYAVTETEIRAELSLPDSMVEGYIDTWLERIILPSVDIPAAVTAATRAADPEVIVTRRAA
jgi:hypothetical protein